MKKDGRSRRSLLTPKRRKIILDTLREGHFPPTAALRAGVKLSTMTKWFQKGDAAIEKGDHKNKYALLAQEAGIAVGLAEADYLATIENSATGANWNRRVTTKRQVVSEDGTVVDLEDEVKTYQRDWKAAAWYLEHRHQHRWRPKEEENPDATIRVKRLVLVGLDPTQAPLALAGPKTIEHDPTPVDPPAPPG